MTVYLILLMWESFSWENPGKYLAAYIGVRNTMHIVYIESFLHVCRFFQLLSACSMSCYLLSPLPSTQCVEPQVTLIYVISVICVKDRKQMYFHCFEFLKWWVTNYLGLQVEVKVHVKGVSTSMHVVQLPEIVSVMDSLEYMQGKGASGSAPFLTEDFSV